MTPFSALLALDAPDPLLIGTPVRHFGVIWIISGINYLHDYDVVRFDASRRVWQYSSIAGCNVPETNPHHWTIPAPEMIGFFARAIRNAERLHPHLQYKSKSAKAWRRARHWRGIMKRWLARVQARRPARYIRLDRQAPTSPCTKPHPTPLPR